MNLIFVCQKTRNLFIAKKLLKPVFRLAFPILTLNTSCSLLTQTSDKTFSSRENKIKSTSSIIQILCLFHNLVPCTFWHDVFQYEIVTYVFVPINWLQACNETVSSILHILHITPYYQRVSWSRPVSEICFSQILMFQVFRRAVLSSSRQSLQWKLINMDPSKLFLILVRIIRMHLLWLIYYFRHPFIS